MAQRVIVRNIESPYLREKEAAIYLGMKTGRTLQNLRWKGGGPAFLKQGKRVLYHKQDLDNWMNANAVRKTRNAEEGSPI